MVVYWREWEPHRVCVRGFGKKFELGMELVQTPKSRVVWEPSNTSICVDCNEEFTEKFREFEEYVRDQVASDLEYRSPLTESEYGARIRISYNNLTDMFDTQNQPINTIKKDSYVRMILKFGVTLSKTSYKLVPELVQLKLTPEPKKQDSVWMGD